VRLVGVDGAGSKVNAEAFADFSDYSVAMKTPSKLDYSITFRNRYSVAPKVTTAISPITT